MVSYSTDDEKRKYPISFREGFTVFMCLGVSLAAIMALVIYVGFFWYLEQQRQLKGRITKSASPDCEKLFIARNVVEVEGAPPST